MTTTAIESPKIRKEIVREAGAGPLSLVAVLAGVLVGYAAFAMLLGVAGALVRGSGSRIDLTGDWNQIGARGSFLLGGLMFLAYLLAGYVSGRMAWRRGALHGLGVFVGSLVVIGAVALFARSVAKPKDIKHLTDALRAFGVPTSGKEWGHVGSLAGLGTLLGMLGGSVLGGLAGERWYTKISRRAGEVDMRTSNGSSNGRSRRRAPGYDQLSREELYQRAQEKDIPGRSQMSKEELKNALQQS
jgi:hypothetical protein